MQTHGERAALLASQGDLESIAMLFVPAGAQLDGDRQRRDGLYHLADGPFDQQRIAQEGRTRAVAADLLHGAAHVDVDGVDGAIPVDCDTRTLREDVGVVPEDLDGEGSLLHRPLQIAQGLVAAVDQAMTGDHLGVRDGRAHLAAEQPKGPVGDARQRREEIPVGQPQRPELDARGHGRASSMPSHGGHLRLSLGDAPTSPRILYNLYKMGFLVPRAVGLPRGACRGDG